MIRFEIRMQTADSQVPRSGNCRNLPLSEEMTGIWGRVRLWAVVAVHVIQWGMNKQLCSLLVADTHRPPVLGRRHTGSINFKGRDKEESSSCHSRVFYCDRGLYAVKYIRLLRYFEPEKRWFDLLFDVQTAESTEEFCILLHSTAIPCLQYWDWYWGNYCWYWYQTD